MNMPNRFTFQMNLFSIYGGAENIENSTELKRAFLGEFILNTSRNLS